MRDEEQNLPRLWASVKRHVDWAVVLDTGSTDDTPTVARLLFNQRTTVHETAWTDFGTARSLSLAIARDNYAPDWFLILDADETLEGPAGWEWPEVEDDVVAVLLRGRYEDGDVSWVRHHLLRANKPWEYRGVLHEYARYAGDDGPDAGKALLTNEPWVLCHGDGIRTRSAKDRTEKFERDYEVLRREVQAHPDEPRNWFYLGQACKDAGRWQEALMAFSRRDEFGDGGEEHYMTCFMAGIILAEHRDTTGEAGEWWLYKALRMRPQRAEPLVGLAALWRERKRYGEAYIAAQRAVWMARPETELFYMSEHFWNWGREDELSVCAFKVGKLSEGIEMTEALIARDDVPEEHKTRMRKNLSEGYRAKEAKNGRARDHGDVRHQPDDGPALGADS